MFKSIETFSKYEQSPLSSSNDIPEDHNCHECDKNFSTYDLLMSHASSHYLDHDVMKTPTKGSHTKNNKRECARKWTCQTCGKAFQSSRGLHEHEVVHTGARDFPCSICGKAFGTAANLRIHRTTHSDQRPFACQTCGAAFRQKDSLKVHVRKHTGERPFVCSVCKMAFDRNFTLKNHMLTHLEKSFVCSICGKAFSSKGGLNSHEHLHFKDSTQPKKERGPRAKSGTGNWVCDECGKIYSTRSNLKFHQKSHEPTQTSHICPVCCQLYKSRDSMEVHMRRHNEDRPFKCNICSRSFYRNYTLKIHILTHTGEKPHQCPKKGCNKSFAQSSSLSCHIRIHQKREADQLNGIVKRPYRKQKVAQEKALDKERNSCNVNVINSSSSSNMTSGPDCGVIQDLKLSTCSVMSQNLDENVADSDVHPIFSDISDNITHHLDHSIASVWNDTNSSAMMEVTNDFHHSSQNGHSLCADLQQQSFISCVPLEALPVLVSSDLYQQDSIHKILADQPLLVPHLP